MWFAFPHGLDAVSVEQQVFVAEWTNETGDNFFRAPKHFSSRLEREAGCRPLALPPAGVPANLPDVIFAEPKIDGTNEQIASLKALLSDEKSTSSALRAQLGAVMHENDRLKLQVHELTEENLELKDQADDEGTDEPVKKK